MRLNKNFLLAITLLSFASPVYCLTWQEILDAVSLDKYDFPSNAKNKHVTFWKKVIGRNIYKGIHIQRVM